MGSFAKRNRTGKMPGGSTQLGPLGRSSTDNEDWTPKHWTAARTRIWRRERREYGADNDLPGFAAFAVASALAGGNDTAIRLAEPVGSSGNSSFTFFKVFL
jgi:hypothetical protein